MSLQFAGTITGCRGVNGAVVLKDVPRDLKSLPEGINVSIGYSASFAREYTLVRFKTTGRRGAVAQLREITSREQAREMKEYGMFVSEEDIRSINDEIVFDNELIGLMVFDSDSGEPIGKVINTMELPANDVWIVNTDRGEIPLPVTDEVIINIDKAARRIEARLPDGIWDLAAGGDNG